MTRRFTRRAKIIISMLLVALTSVVMSTLSGVGAATAADSATGVGCYPCVTGTPTPARVGWEYSYEFTITGAVHGVRADGELPPGLVLGMDGRLSGVPTSGGDYTFDVQVWAWEWWDSVHVTLHVAGTVPQLSEPLSGSLWNGYLIQNYTTEPWVLANVSSSTELRGVPTYILPGQQVYVEAVYWVLEREDESITYKSEETHYDASLNGWVPQYFTVNLQHQRLSADTSSSCGTRNSPSFTCRTARGNAYGQTVFAIENTTPVTQTVTDPAAQAEIVQMCSGTLARCDLIVDGPPENVMLERQIVTPIWYNCRPTETTEVYRWEHAIYDTNSLGVELGTEIGFTSTIKATLKASYGHTWTTETRYASEVRPVLSPYHVGWVEVETPAYRVYTHILVTLGNGYTWRLDDVSFTSPVPATSESAPPAGSHGYIQSRPMSDAEKTNCAQ